MAKFTTKFVRDNIEATVGDQLDFDALKVTSKQKSKKSNGKMVEVVNKEATVQAIEGNLLYYRGYLDAMMVFESKFPEGIADIINGKMADWEALRATFEEEFPDEHEAWAEQFNIEPYEDVEAADSDDSADEGEDEESEEDEGTDYSEMSLSELRAECKERGIKYTPKDKSEALVEKLEAWDEENSDADEETGDDTEEESADYSAMSLGELRKECKARGIKYTPKDKADALIAKLEEDDGVEPEEDEPDESEEEDEESTDYSALSLGELRKLAKERGIKYSPKTKSEELVAALEEYDEENSDDSADEGEDEESEEDEGTDYSEMSLSELRAECKERGIKYTPKMKAEDLISKLEEDDASSEDEEEDEDSDDEADGDEEVSEEDLDQILDEEFEDETLTEEESKAPAKGNKAKKLPPKKSKK